MSIAAAILLWSGAGLLVAAVLGRAADL